MGRVHNQAFTQLVSFHQKKREREKIIMDFKNVFRTVYLIFF
jgi:hypothetical protein